MKRLSFNSLKYLFIYLILLSTDVKSQYNFVAPPSPATYDLLYVFDTNYFANCFSTDDTLRTMIPVDFGTWWDTLRLTPYSTPYSKFRRYNAKNREWCNPDAPVPDGYVIGANCTEDTSAHYAEAFAQEYHFDYGDIPYNDYVICGVAIKLGFGAVDDVRDLSILDENFDTIATTIYHTLNVIANPSNPNSTVHWNKHGWNTYYFPSNYYDTLTNITDFRIAFDVPMYGHGNTFQVHHTCNVYSPCIRDSINALGGAWQAGLCYDTIFMGMVSIADYWYNDFLINPPAIGETHYPYWSWLEYIKQFDEEDNIPLCSFPDPKYIKRNGEWIEFSEDPVYEIWRNIYIEMVPIIMVPQESSQLSEVELEKMCYVFPNPAKDVFKVMSHYTIKDIQVFDMIGKKVLEKEVNYFETEIIVDNLTSGTYIVRINTAKGTTEKKLVIQ